jgi:5-(carboxyamino)imidazole ribonucleotide synthase
VILPGATLGVLGGGQLGRMFVVAARTMGYRTVVLDPDPHSPAAVMADHHIAADYHDRPSLEELGKACAAVTTEFENVPAETLRVLTGFCAVRPSAEAVTITQDRLLEKAFLQTRGFPTATFHPVRSLPDLDSAAALLREPALLKRASLGYDGKGQVAVAGLEQARSAFGALGDGRAILEKKVALCTELSVVLARSVRGEVGCFPVVENIHRDGILDTSIVPARVPAEQADLATHIAVEIAETLDYCGVLAVEFFITENDELLVNEIAPRPHNSGHYTLDACLTSQFVQQVRTLCGLPPGEPRLLSPAVMVNLLGDVWTQGEPRWAALLKHPAIKLHLYGKREARPGRKMGHFTCVDPDLQRALATAGRVAKDLCSCNGIEPQLEA